MRSRSFALADREHSPDMVIMSIRDNFTEGEQEAIITSAMKRTALTRKQVEQFLESRERPSKRNPMLERQWVRNLHAVCEALRGGEADPDGLFAQAFWIGLYGVLVELRQRFRNAPETKEQLQKLGKSHPFITASAAVFEACEAIRAALSDEEIVFVTYMRQIHAHIYQDGFEYAIERGNPQQNQPGAIRDKQMIPILRRHVAVDDAHRILDEISSKNGDDVIRVVTNFAHKVGPFVEQLEAAMVALEAGREQDRIDSERWRASRADEAG
jgi:hypothetical protein